jgi:hypothetical protein
MVLMIARRETGPRERQPKMQKEELKNNSGKPRDPVKKQAWSQPKNGSTYFFSG